MQPEQLIEKVQLSGRLGEFRNALEEEIYAAKLIAFGNGLQLKSGRRIARIANSFQYVFLLDKVINLPADSPGELHFPDKKSAEVTIISIDGMSLVLSSRLDFGDFISSAKLVTDLTFLMRKLIERIEELSSQKNILGDRILANEFLTVNQWSLSTNDLLEINAEQLSALSSSMNRDLTYVWGPPGTGKTRTIGAIGYQLQLENRSLLMVSHTNTAVDQALIRIAESAGKEKLSNGKIIRVGDPKDPKIAKEYPDLLLATHVVRRSEELTRKLETIRSEIELCREESSKLLKDIELYDWFIVAREDLNDLHLQQDQLELRHDNLENAKDRFKELKEKTDYWIKACNSAKNLSNHHSLIKELDGRAAELNIRLNKAQAVNQKIIKFTKMAEATLQESESVNWIIRKWRGLPEPEIQQRVVTNLHEKMDKSANECLFISGEFESIKEKIRGFSQELVDFASIYSGGPDEILKKVATFESELSRAAEQEKEFQDQYRDLKTKMTRKISEKLNILQNLGYHKNYEATISGMFSAMEEIFSEIYRKIQLIDIQISKSKLQNTVKRISEIETEINNIKQMLGKIEEVIISEADIVATTLTRAYLKDSVRARKYDTIIVDEASMAPIPAIWVAASLAENNAIIVGDWKQLPPIVVSEKDFAKKWLGRDVFKVAGVIDKDPENLIKLNEQFRMNRQIASIPNELFYDGGWRFPDKESVSDFKSWYNLDWEPDAPVILIDTGSLNAWVTSVPQGKSSSRLNFLSALLCIDICKMLLKENKASKGDSETNRIFIESPYRPHTEFLNSLISEYELDTDVRAGTIHSFQGSEADVVIFDLVNDDPQWRVGLFTPERDEMTKRLINVGITRALNRLIIVGDFSYNQKSAKNAFLGKEFIPFLTENFQLHNALDIVPIGIQTRAANASRLYSKGYIEADASRIVVTQDDFYPLLLDDVLSAKKRIVIYSPFMTQNRIAQLQPCLLSAIEKGVSIFIVTKPIQERKRNEVSQYKYVEKALQGWGVTIVHKHGMHEKLVIIDNDIIWSGSLNPLSFSNTQEIMERRISETLVKDYSRIIMLDTLIGEYDEGTPKCPVCESEMVASEGRDTPYYWKCVRDGCYSRSVDQPQIKNGVIVCATPGCGGDVEFGVWGEQNAWRCIKNRHHHQKMIPSHLNLPQMRKKIPQDILARLEKNFGTFTNEVSVDGVTQLSFLD